MVNYFREQEQYLHQKQKIGKISKKTFDWVNVVLTDSQYPIAAKHFAFAFETRDLHNILNFECSLVDDQGKLIEFQTGKDKMSALNFNIQTVK